MKHLAKTTYSFRLSFRVPDVPPGEYTVSHCSEPCEEKLAGLADTPITIVASAPEAAAVRYAARVDDRLERLIWRVDGKLQWKLKRTTKEVFGALAERIALQSRRIDRLVASRSDSQPAAPILEAGLSVIAAGALLSVILILVLRRRVEGQPNVQG
jgi:hypothetical protein